MICFIPCYIYSRGVSEGGYRGALFGRIEGAALLLALLLGGHLRPSIVYILYLLFLIKKKSRKPFEDVEAEICVDVFKGKISCIS